MTRREEVDILRSRALGFLSQAESALREGRHDLASFLAEQAAQLRLKSALLEVSGDYPRTRSIKILLSELIKSRPSKELQEFIQTNRREISDLEDAYIMARYTTKSYDLDDARDHTALASQIVRLVEAVLRS